MIPQAAINAAGEVTWGIEPESVDLAALQRQWDAECHACGGTGEIAFDYATHTRYRVCDICEGDGK